MGYTKKKYYNKKKYNKKKTYKKNGNGGNYRRQVARIARPLNVKPRSAMQNVTYYNSFRCQPKINILNAVGLRQQNYNIVLGLNTLWPFASSWEANATSNDQTCTPNDPITEYASPVTDAMTIMPAVKDGPALFQQYSGCCVVGTIGVIPSLNGLDTPVTDFCLQIRVEQRLLWTEPLESLTGESAGEGNYSFPWAALGVASALYLHG
jgi:hypothetical protein